jgi:hypothetical protein
MREDWDAVFEAWDHRRFPRLDPKRRNNEARIDAMLSGSISERRLVIGRAVDTALADAHVRDSFSWSGEKAESQSANGTGATTVAAVTLKRLILSQDEAPIYCSNPECGEEVARSRIRHGDPWCDKEECRRLRNNLANRRKRERDRLLTRSV